MRGRKSHLTLANRFVVFGGIAKALHYLGENYGVMRGFSYGTVVVWPVQTVVILLISTLVLKEKVTRRAVAGAFLCVSGIVLLTWNGAPLGEFIGSQGPLLIAFVVAGTGASLFSVCQKKLLARLDTVELNTSMFLIGGLCAGGVVPLGGAAVTGPIRLPAAAAMLILGAITGVGFLLQAEGFKRVPLFVATVVQSSTVLLSLLWAALLYHERITGWIIAGTALFLAGILCVNAKPGSR